ncbi:ADP-ribose pyrophosphatase YjhB (NUDIX family) [Planomicrobium soli]|uniref:ADP-ribose pyrophosphatase YjhB (NUDIX family) n=1 Tax=Planomicrobium soli TaxID=1176648 RepID=A0A2P8GGB0_9BACL|nr:NUDIX domain-containing protein [Planomicrobium soli]PSL32970.1 ADP-ribose pyrophosphatase YjhB (NUDIX family) [Planomicrobium soli]
MFIVNVEAAIYKDEKWLIVRRSEKEEHAAGALALVGGKVDKEGNSTDILERTLIREVEEEVGVIISNLAYVNSSSFVTDSGTHVIDIVFLCSYQAGEPIAKDPDEVASVNWMSTEEILDSAEIPSYLKENIQLANDLVKAKESYLINN